MLIELFYMLLNLMNKVKDIKIIIAIFKIKPLKVNYF